MTIKQNSGLVGLVPDREVLADLYYISAYAADLERKVVAGELKKSDTAHTQRLMELSAKVAGQVNLRLGPW